MSKILWAGGGVSSRKIKKCETNNCRNIIDHEKNNRWGIYPGSDEGDWDFNKCMRSIRPVAILHHKDIVRVFGTVMTIDDN